MNQIAVLCQLAIIIITLSYKQAVGPMTCDKYLYCSQHHSPAVACSGLGSTGDTLFLPQI